MRTLPRLAVHTQFHPEVVRIGDLVRGNNPGADGTATIEAFSIKELASVTVLEIAGDGFEASVPVKMPDGSTKRYV